MHYNMLELGIDCLILNNAEVLSFQKAHVTLYMQRTRQKYSTYIY